ncbi:ABC transporter permease [Streptomyces sp. NPDC057939]|uniref:ABC transporter permease n=1 Tax=Streptomyces sp. NPDC057939 TaxID=3346284 RepID=UPI0036EDAD1A
MSGPATAPPPVAHVRPPSPQADHATARNGADPARGAREVDNRAAYLAFGLAYVLGHGAAALTEGSAPLLGLPGWLPPTLLWSGLVAGIVLATIAAARAQQGAAAEVLSGRLLGTAWIAAFTVLFLAITGLTSLVDEPQLQSVLWPAGSGLVVGLLYLAEGAVRRNVLHYGLGLWLALISTAALPLATPGLYWVLAVGGGGAYVIAAALEHRRLAATA